MPRLPTGVYEQPFPDVVPDTTIESAVYNGFVNDIETDLNTARPIVAGGTGAATAAAARTSLEVERSGQQVTNFNTHVWENGSFYSDGSATGEPVDGQAFTGIYYSHSNPDYATIEARNMADSVNPGRVYVRQKVSGVWGTWTAEDDRYVNVAGDTMTGNLTLSHAAPALTLNKTIASSLADILGTYVGLGRWLIRLGNPTTEAGSHTGSDFDIYRYADDGSIVDAPLTINRASGGVTLNKDLTVFRSFDTNKGNILLGASGTAVIGYDGTKFVLGTGPTQVTGLGVGATPGSLPGFYNGVTGVDISDGYVSASRAASPVYVCNMNSDGGAVNFFRSGASVGSISVTTTATAYNTTSDERLKEDLKSFDAGNIIDDTMVYDFKWKETGERAYGVIAQQAVQVYDKPTFHDTENDKWFIDYSKYVPVLLQELKALRARVLELEGKVGIGAQPA